MKYEALRKTKLRTAAEVALTVKSGDRVDYGVAYAEPDLFDAALAARKSELKDVLIRGTLSMHPHQVVIQDPHQRHFIYENWHFTGHNRKAGDLGLTGYVPFNFGEAPSLYRNFLEVDLVVIKTTPMDRHGNFNFGINCSFVRAICDVAKRVVVETCSEMPVVHGIENTVHISEVDAVIEGDNLPLPELHSAPVSDVDRQVADYVLREIADGACLQVGVGSMPSAICSSIAASKLRDLGIHTELFNDGMLDLVEAGTVTGRRKQSFPGKIVFTFTGGTKRTFDFVDRNESCLALPVDQTNLPHKIAENHNVVSINNCMQIDITGQVASESSGHRQISGTGGQLQFVRGAFMSHGGKSFMCMSSQYMRGKSPASRIVMGLEPGTVVTTPRTDVMYVVTEYCMTNLKGKSVAERARALIGIAHPDDREALYAAARKSGILGKRHM